MSIEQSVHDLVTADVTAEEFMRQVKELMDFSDWPTDSDYGTQLIVDALQMGNRYDILETLKDDPVYGEKASSELRLRQRMKEEDRKWAAQVATYPSILKEMRSILLNTCKIGFYDLCYPSGTAVRLGAGENNFAISGDGLFLFMFEIVSMEGRGLFKLVPRPNDPHRPELKGSESQDSKAFRTVGNWEFGNILTGDHVIDTLKKAYPPI